MDRNWAIDWQTATPRNVDWYKWFSPQALEQMKHAAWYPGRIAGWDGTQLLLAHQPQADRYANPKPDRYVTQAQPLRQLQADRCNPKPSRYANHKPNRYANPKPDRYTNSKPDCHANP